MADIDDSAKTPVWNLSAAQWQTLVQRVQGSPDALEDGAYVRVEVRLETAEVVFWATALNKPLHWAYPFLEPIAGTVIRGASIGRAWHEAETGFVQFEVAITAAAQELAADYENGASDLDFVTYEQAVELAVRGTPHDLVWLHHEFGRLIFLTGTAP